MTIGKLSSGAIAVAVVVGLGWLYGELRDHRARSEERAAAREQQLRDSTAAAAVLDSLRHAADSVALKRAARDNADVGRLEQGATIAAGVADSLLREAQKLVNDSVSAIIERARVDFATALQKKDSALTKERDRSGLFYQRWRSADSAAVRWEHLAHQWQAQSDYWRSRQPSTLERILTVASCAVAGAAASEKKVLVGGGAGALCLITGS